MPPRIRASCVQQLTNLTKSRTTFVCSRCTYASIATASSTSSTEPQIHQNSRFSPVNPPSHRDPKYRKSQLLRSYVSLLQTTPLIILFQHNNLKAVEWASIRRELANALKKVDDTVVTQSGDQSRAISDSIKLTVIRTNIFEPALRIAEYYKPENQSQSQESEEAQGVADEKLDPELTHALSRNAYLAIQTHKGQHDLSPLLTGSVAVLNFPVVSPQHVKAALSILSPQAPMFAAPTRRSTPGYYELPVQDGLKKLLMLGARIDGQTFDIEGTRWVGSIDGGIDGLRAQLVGMLQGFAGGLTQTLESASRSIWYTMEGRRRMLGEEQSPKTEETKS